MGSWRNGLLIASDTLTGLVAGVGLGRTDMGIER